MRSPRGRLCHRDGPRTGRKDRAGMESEDRQRNAVNAENKREGAAAGAAKLHLAHCYEKKEAGQGEGEGGCEAGVNGAAGGLSGLLWVKALA